MARTCGDGQRMWAVHVTLAAGLEANERGPEGKGETEGEDEAKCARVTTPSCIGEGTKQRQVDGSGRFHVAAHTRVRIHRPTDTRNTLDWGKGFGRVAEWLPRPRPRPCYDPS